MCGIVGILGSKPVAIDLVDALRRLEYRGYDSARASPPSRTATSSAAAPRASCAISRRACRQEPLEGRTGIGHTRWATHGKPIERNAHPHMSAKVSVVHNGIIENYRELKAELTAKGHVFASDTDTEAVVHLITDEMQQGHGPVEAVRRSLQRLDRRVRARHHLRRPRRPDDRRAPGLAARHRPRRRRDVPGLRRHRAGPVHRHDHLSRRGRLGGDDAHRRRDLRSLRRSASSGPWSKSVASSLLVDKGNHRHFMAKEIHEQPEVISHTLVELSRHGRGAGQLPRSRHRSGRRSRASRSRLAARPTMRASSASTGSSATPAFPSRSMSPRSSATARRRCRRAGSPLFVSQSGETADTLATLRYAKEHGQRIASIVNVRTSTIARESHAVLPTLAGPEIGVASTKAFTCQLAVLACLAIALGRARGTIDAAKERELVQALVEVPRHISHAAAQRAAVRGACAHAVEGARRDLSRPRHQLSRSRSKAR